MRKVFCFLISLVAISSILFAQETVYTINGTVSDKIDVLIGVTITVQGKMGGTVTDLDGKFSIRASKGDRLIFSYVGYQAQEYLVTGEETNLEILLEASAQELEEVVVTAMGTQRKISSLASIASVEVDDLQIPTPSITNLLGGRVAGVIT